MQMSIATVHGMGLVFLSTLCFTTGNVLLSGMGKKVPPLQSAFSRFIVQASISFFSIAVTNREHIYSVSTWIGLRNNFKKIIFRSLFGIMAVVSWYTAVQSMPLADATAINYLSIPMTSILACIILKEPYRFVIMSTASTYVLNLKTHSRCVLPASSTQ